MVFYTDHTPHIIFTRLIIVINKSTLYIITCRHSLSSHQNWQTSACNYMSVTNTIYFLLEDHNYCAVQIGLDWWAVREISAGEEVCNPRVRRARRVACRPGDELRMHTTFLAAAIDSAWFYYRGASLPMTAGADRMDPRRSRGWPRPLYKPYRIVVRLCLGSSKGCRKDSQQERKWDAFTRGSRSINHVRQFSAGKIIFNDLYQVTILIKGEIQNIIQRTNLFWANSL